ncbi:nucleoside 2-deoxyribosyltransferase [Deinococcus maricopensis]|uniref:Uncharacterized protein n=1 Tax=Deinococcus maricopensis (strain DSM 21211 / LMG 22137 / NRRL B-23946 / LB-34) TaxID=709986 RepID=E8U7T7_DEIML|nr:nucleoside 2-deoxyribosyltransferase [Deinococcus maricopensis]ADV67126.1 hypothetical protein Deima_1477 [Deinococcus maricopensis DSM 21211]
MTAEFARLARGDAPAYLCTRVFHHGGRLVGARLERAVRAALTDALAARGLPITGPLTFLPYRDSNGAVLLGPQFTRGIYAVDTAQIGRATLVVAPIEDLNLDSSIAFELGFAGARGVPVLSALQNVVRFRHPASGVVSPLPPLLTPLAGTVVDAGAFPADGAPRDPDAYLAHVEDALTRTEAQVRAAVPAALDAPVPAWGNVPVRAGHLHVEVGGPSEDARAWAARTASALADAGWFVTTATREGARTRADLDAAVREDLHAALGAQVLVTRADTADMDAEAAAVTGLRAGLGRATVLSIGWAREVWNGDAYVLPVNLMPLHGARASVRTDAALLQAVQALMGDAATPGG